MGDTVKIINDDGTDGTAGVDNDKVKYYENQELSGLKPYVSYSCHYKKGNTDVVITYSLDNYVVIKGKAEKRRNS